jgi:phosphoribosylanthranilate isomerase
MTDVKICGITCREDAEVAARAGARYIGAVMYAASARNVDPQRARAFSAGLAPELVLVVADESPETVADWARRAGAAVVQLHGDESPQTAEAVADAGPWAVWKGVRARTPEQVRAAVRRFDSVEAILVDGWHPERIGGTGARVGWRDLTDLSAVMREGQRLVAAGGLTPENVAQVVRIARPDVVDVSSGVERSPGRKDPERIRAFVRAVTGLNRITGPADNHDR